jgi:hypothetical protein
MVHLFRPQDPAIRPTPPVGTWLIGPWTEGRLLVALRRVAGHLRRRWRPCISVAIAGLFLIVELVLMFVAFYLVDLSISLMELWAELAAKHLEITLS